jgi:2',3'-cyclic-nucleotide 2'-phosphodiesterase/3'-nucleotidase/5'-nucleotidase
LPEIRPDLFNQDDGDFDDRSDDKGVEPEAIAVGEVGGRVLTFVGLERDNGVFVYDVSNPSAPEYVTYIDSEANGNISPETIAFVPAADSTSGKAQILVAYEGDGNTVVYDVETVIPAGQRIVGTNQNDNLIGGDGSDTINGLNGDDTLIGGETDRDLADLIIGGNGSDSADGGAGNDLIYGMNGEDTLIGGLGATRWWARTARTC